MIFKNSKLTSELQTLYNIVNILPRFCAELVYAKMPIFAEFRGTPNTEIPAANYIKVPRSGGSIYSGNGGFEWNDDANVSLKFKSPRTFYAIFSAQIQNSTNTDSVCYLRTQVNQNLSTARLTRFRVPTNDEESATLVLGYNLSVNDVVDFEVYSSVAGLRLTRFNLLIINAPHDTVSLSEMV